MTSQLEAEYERSLKNGQIVSRIIAVIAAVLMIAAWLDNRSRLQTLDTLIANQQQLMRELKHIQSTRFTSDDGDKLRAATQETKLRVDGLEAQATTLPSTLP